MRPLKWIVGLYVLAAASASPGTTPAQASEEAAGAEFRMSPIGAVQKEDGRTALVLRPAFEPALLGLDGFSHVWVLWWFDRNDTPAQRSILRVHPRGDRENPLTGVFATRSPVRPNLIAKTLCRIVSVTNNVVEVDDIDAFDDTPILDLKPYIPGNDTPDGPTFFPNWL